MEHADFKIGTEFMSEVGRWRCTDVGTRIITAVRLNHDDEPAMYIGPPYKVAEHVFDEYDVEGLEPAPPDRMFDDSGRAILVIVRRNSRGKGNSYLRVASASGRDFEQRASDRQPHREDVAPGDAEGLKC